MSDASAQHPPGPAPFPAGTSSPPDADALLGLGPRLKQLLHQALDAPELPTVAAPHLDRYRVVRLIGEGGMGSVYEAEQLSPRRPVALKVIKAGMDTRQVIRRFEAEREALARMDHPNIAKVHDAGRRKSRPAAIAHAILPRNREPTHPPKLMNPLPQSP